MGTDAASMILDRCPDTHIVFVTAYDQYAVEAFELYALDYVLKPVSAARLEKTIARLREKAESRSASAKRLTICCFGGFEIGWDGEAPVKWRTEKTRELFAFLLHNKGRTVRKNEIVEAIWPSVAFDRADHQLHNAIYSTANTERLCVPRVSSATAADTGSI
jgi:two-component SAPR family response regulator